MTPRAYFNLFLLNMITSPCVTVDNASDKTKNILSMVPNSNSNCQKMSTTDQESTQLNTETSACFAIVPYDSSALPPMHVERKEFKFAGRLLHIKQNWAELGVAAIVWDAVSDKCWFGSMLNFCTYYLIIAEGFSWHIALIVWVWRPVNQVGKNSLFGTYINPDRDNKVK